MLLKFEIAAGADLITASCCGSGVIVKFTDVRRFKLFDFKSSFDVWVLNVLLGGVKEGPEIVEFNCFELVTFNGVNLLPLFVVTVPSFKTGGAKSRVLDGVKKFSALDWLSTNGVEGRSKRLNEGSGDSLKKFIKILFLLDYLHILQ